VVDLSAEEVMQYVVANLPKKDITLEIVSLGNPACDSLDGMEMAQDIFVSEGNLWLGAAFGRVNVRF
jgi:hypothetical protein